jgi:spoIIIJ-associated protein
MTLEEGELAPDEELRDLVEALVESLSLDATVEVVETDGELRGGVSGVDAGELIGADGELINAVQYLAQRIVLRGGDGPRVIVDADGYRARRVERLHADADLAAEAAIDEGRAVPMTPLPAAERRIVHEYLRDRGDVGTHSEGDEPNRRLVVSPLVG